MKVRGLWHIALSLLIFFPIEALSDDSLLLDEIVVTASRWEQPASRIPNRITSITDEEISRLPARDAGEALDYMPGVVMDRTGGVGSPVFPSVQGSEFYQTTVLINGIPFNDLANGLGNLGQIPSEQIERIEVIHGPSGSEWGSALGGVINVITHKPDRERGNSAGFGVGDYATRFGAFSLQHFSDSAALSMGGGLRKSEGPQKEMRSHSSANLVADANMDIGEDSLLSILGYTFQGSVGTGKYRGALDGYWEKVKYRTYGGGASLATPAGPGGMKLTGYIQSQTNNTLQNMKGIGQLDDIRLEDRIYGGSAIWHVERDATSITAGAEGKSGRLKSTSLVNDSYQLNTSGAFLNLQHDVSNATLYGALRYSQEDTFGIFTGYNVGTVYRPSGKPLKLSLSVSRGYTTPPLGMRYVDYPGVFAPNPALKVEKVTHYQAGVSGEAPYGVKGGINAFYADVTDAISVATNDDGILYYKNFQKFRRKGVEAEISWEASNGLTLFANTLQQEIRDASTDTVVTDKVRATYAVGVGYDYTTFSFLVTGVYRDWNAADRSQVKDREFLWNAKASYSQRITGGVLQTGLSVYNISNAELATNIMLPPTPPRQIEASVSYIF